jgi:hypothetical protein
MARCPVSLACGHTLYSGGEGGSEPARTWAMKKACWDWTMRLVEGQRDRQHHAAFEEEGPTLS